MPEWTQEQQDVIYIHPESRVVVNAGPGTGKTAVACARVAALVDKYDIEPSNIMLISFTRVAVAEIRDRIAKYLKDNQSVFSVTIATLDSFAWTLHSGFRDNLPKLDYNENISSVIKLVQTDEGVQDYLKTIEHLVVDEAQDIVGQRAELILQILGQLSEDCGVTVFSDEAQAIYGFADDEESNANENQRSMLVEYIAQADSLDFQALTLKEIHRVHSENLKYIFSETRVKVMETVQHPLPDSWEIIKQEIKDHADRSIEVPIHRLHELPENSFVLYRRRVEVLLASSFMSLRQHRIRMSGLPTCIAPWVGACLSGHTEPKLQEKTFLQLWVENVSEELSGSLEPEKAWDMLFRTAGENANQVDMSCLRRRLGRKKPPSEFCLPTVGFNGPLFGTIHASKGREADHVFLMFPQNGGNNNGDAGEEIRVLFVGATRARETLVVGDGYRHWSSTLLTKKRNYHIHDDHYVQVEFGRENDIDALSIASREIIDQTAQKIQKNLRDIGTNPIEVNVYQLPNHAFKIFSSEKCMGYLSLGVNSDLFKIGDAIQTDYGGYKRKPPREINHLRIMGIRTIVLPPDSPICEKLWEPWSSSGLILAPVIVGYPKCYFPFQARRRY